MSAAGLVAALRRVSVLADLPEEDLAWLATQGQEARYTQGEVVNRQGEPADMMLIFLEGAAEARREEDGLLGTRYVARAGEPSEVSGKLPYSRLTSFPSTSRAVEPTWLLRVPERVFPELLSRLPVLGQRLVAVMSDRIRDASQGDSVRERLLALGRLSAGLAHELNNPAAAGRRAAAGLRSALHDLRSAGEELHALCLDPAARGVLTALERRVAGDPRPHPTLSSLERGDREDELAGWLDGRSVPGAWDLAPVLVEAGVEPGDLDALAGRVPEIALTASVRHLGATLAVDALTREVEDSAGRISDLVGAIKEHTHQDRAPRAPTDVRRGLDSTLTLLGHKLRRGVRVEREDDPDLPLIEANAGELNQVWTNLIDNAVDAMNGRGRLLVRAVRSGGSLLVEIVDDGPGIPEGVRAHIFEPFFTTKPVGVGSGLGLDISRRIVRGHGGDLNVTSRPGETRFQVRLPLG
ncbi:sensor histidine kinase (plasmid) [Deinococcus aetherius]|uniref:histidine kinase n=1 Tax=Deinococcus aetherius TaxID=200252 RepID=A0ABM8AIT6_9DEIO|nr:ATP-binding protein [Deinococcus aetherius]BDP43692.1 sensor histidine kinase [Deinococcus aetherius]